MMEISIEQYNKMAERLTQLEYELDKSVKVVRCKDCKYYNKHKTYSSCTYWTGDPYEQASVEDEDFCSYGERRDADV